MKTRDTYNSFQKPSWAPPSWVFGPVWTFLYIIIVISFGTVFYAAYNNLFSWAIALPFILNIIFNILYTPIQFRLKNFTLALIDILLVDVTLIWAMIVIYPYLHGVTYLQVPYLAWISFATVLQVAIVKLNKKSI